MEEVVEEIVGNWRLDYFLYLNTIEYNWRLKNWFNVDKNTVIRMMLSIFAFHLYAPCVRKHMVMLWNMSLSSLSHSKE